MKSEFQIPKLVMASDMANRWGIDRRVVNNWTRRDDNFPKPVQTVGCDRYPLYLYDDMIRYEKIKGIEVKGE